MVDFSVIKGAKIIMNLNNIGMDIESIEALMDTLTNFGLDVNLSLVKVKDRSYQIGVHVRCEKEGSDTPIDVESYVESNNITEAVEIALTDILEKISLATKPQPKKTEETIESLKVDKALLEQRIDNLTRQLNNEKKKVETRDQLIDLFNPFRAF